MTINNATISKDNILSNETNQKILNYFRVNEEISHFIIVGKLLTTAILHESTIKAIDTPIF